MLARSQLFSLTFPVNSDLHMYGLEWHFFGVGKLNQPVKYDWFADLGMFRNDELSEYGSLNVHNSSSCLNNRTAHHPDLASKMPKRKRWNEYRISKQERKKVIPRVLKIKETEHKLVHKEEFSLVRSKKFTSLLSIDKFLLQDKNQRCF